MDAGHRPVMLAEVLAVLEPGRGGLYVDGTVGAAGHAAALLAASAPAGLLLGLDRDPQALKTARRNLTPFADRVRLVEATFDHIGEELRAWGRGPADGILLDLGVSSMQLDQAPRGFSFRADAPLDMRMSGQGETAAQLLARLEEGELARLIAALGEEPFARRIARALTAAKAQRPIATTGRLAELVSAALPAAERRRRKLNPATQVFQALRLAVNDELGMLERFLGQVPGWLAPQGRLVVLSYHSLEDRRVKQAIGRWARPCTCPPELPVCACGRRPLFMPLGRLKRPGASEVADNPRARSARLRAALRTQEAA
ncbi:MAG: 16S rRNA (cytosine(1402)-N(4))-methyltransferase RsmH [Thermodesulfobacteriota bacterium]